MHNSQDRNYYVRRANEARRLADAAIDPGIRSIHLQMYGQYERLAAGEQVTMSVAGEN